MKCCICSKEIPNINGWDCGNSALPVKNGRCCNECDDAIVIPARLKIAIKEMAKRKAKGGSK